MHILTILINKFLWEILSRKETIFSFIQYNEILYI
jgi:hypothetical protein